MSHKQHILSPQTIQFCKKRSLKFLFAVAGICIAIQPLKAQLANFSAQYNHSQGSNETFNICKTLNNQLLLAGMKEGTGGVSGGAYPNFLNQYNDAQLLQVNTDGTPIFTRLLSTDFDDRLFESVKTTDGFMVSVGYSGQGFTVEDRQVLSLPENAQNAATLVTKINSAGTVIWQKNFDLGGLDDQGYSIIRFNNNSFFVLGRSFRQVLKKYVITLMHLDGAGNILTANIIHDNFKHDLCPKKMIRTNDGGILILATTNQKNGSSLHSPDPIAIKGSGILLIKLNSTGSVQFSTVIEPNVAGSYLIGVSDMVEDQAGNVVICGNSSAGNYVIKINPAGVVTHAKKFKTGQNFMSVSPQAIVRRGSGFLVSGFTSATGVPHIELSSSLTLVQARRHHFGTSIRSLENTSTGDVFLAGEHAFNTILLKWPAGGSICSEYIEEAEIVDFDINQLNYPVVISETSDNLQADIQSELKTINNSFYCQTPAPRLSGPAMQELNPSIYPNPANTEINLQIPEGESATIQIFDLQGRIMLEKTVDAGFQTLSVSHLENGMYLVKTRTTTNANTQRLVIQH